MLCVDLFDEDLVSLLLVAFMKRFICFLLILTFVCCQKTVKPPKPPASVSAIRVAAKTIPADFEYIGVGESSHIVQIRARVEGYLESIDYKEGALVKKGDLMFVLDQRPFIADVEKAQGTVERMKALLWNAEQTKARMVPLYLENAVSQRDLDNAVAEEWSAKGNLDSAEAELYHAQLNLGFASITAPVTGLASQAKYREGALIAPGEENLLTTMYVVDPIWINFSVSDQDLLAARFAVQKKQLEWPKDMNFKIEAILSNGIVLPGEGFIDFTNPALQQSTGTLLVRAILANPNLYIYPGQFVSVVLKGATRPNAILVPQTAVVQGQNGPFVFLIQDGKAVQQSVQLGDWYLDYWIILDGLKVGDLVIAEGVNKIRNGSPVNIQQMAPSAPEEKTDS